MEFLNGGTLDSLSKNKRLNENQVKFYAAFWSLRICVYFMLNKRYPFETTESLMFNEITKLNENISDYESI
jgi:hypothetical protein